MAAGFELEARIGALAADAGDHLAIATQFGLAGGNEVHLPALFFGVAAVHAQQIGGKQRRLVAAGAGTDFQKQVALVVGVAWQECRLQGALQALHLGREAWLLFFRQRPELGIGQHEPGLTQFVFTLAIVVVQTHHLADVGVLAAQLAVAFQILGDIAVAQQGVELQQALTQLLQFMT